MAQPGAQYNQGHPQPPPAPQGGYQQYAPGYGPPPGTPFEKPYPEAPTMPQLNTQAAPRQGGWWHNRTRKTKIIIAVTVALVIIGGAAGGALGATLGKKKAATSGSGSSSSGTTSTPPRNTDSTTAIQYCAGYSCTQTDRNYLADIGNTAQTSNKVNCAEWNAVSGTCVSCLNYFTAVQPLVTSLNNLCQA